MSGSVSNRGKELLALFARSGCLQSGENLSGDDLDWVWETSDSSTVEFLDWMCKNVHKENVLTESEIREWEELKKRSPESILSGQRLQEAVNVLKSDEAEFLTNLQDDENLRRRVEITREELDVAGVSINEIRDVNRSVSGSRGKLSVALGKIDGRKDEVKRELVTKQHKIIHANEELKISLDQLTQKIKEISEILEKSQSDARFPSGSDLGVILREDERVLSGIRDFIRSRFEATQDDPNFLMGGQEQQEFESLVEEVDRVRFSYADVERKQLMLQAELAGLKAGCFEVEKQIQLLKQGKYPQDLNYLETSISKMTENLNDLRKKIRSVSEDVIPPLVDKNVALHCKEILAADLKTKLQRQKTTIGQMDTLLEFLFESITSQEILGSLFQHEIDNLDDLNAELEGVALTQEQIQANHRESMELFEEAKDLKLKNSRKTLRHNDHVACAINQIIDEKDTESTLVTLSEVLKSAKDLKDSAERLETKLNQTDREVALEQGKLKSLISKIQEELHIGSSENGILTSPEVSARVQQSQTDIRHFEVSVKNSVDAWDRARRSLRDNPNMTVERAIWKDFFNQPEILERHIQTVRARKAAS